MASNEAGGASATNGRGGVVVTGASTGIGRACAAHLDRMGFRVFAGVRKEADAEALRAEGSERLTPVMLDVIDGDSIAAARGAVAEAMGGAGLAGLVNNAGVSVPGPLEFLPPEELRRQLEVNLVGQVAVTQAFLPMLRAARGRIVNMGSVGGRVAAPFLGAYGASKFAIEAITDSLRQELRPWGIHVAVVEPGSIATPIWEKGQRSADDMAEQLPAEGRELYGKAMVAVKEIADKTAARGLPPEVVAKAVAHALTAEKPKTRYLIGRDARGRVALSTVLPDRVTDRIVARVMGLPSSA